MLDLDPRYLSIVKKILATYAKDKTVWVYGSRIKGTSHAGSDLDLAIMDTNSPLSTETLSAIKAAFSESDLPISVDILNWSAIPERFKDEIKETHEVIQEPQNNSF